MKHAFVKLAILLLLSFCFSCSKSDFLDKKPSTSLVVPTSLGDFTKLLDNNNMNVSGILGTVSADDYYLPTYKIWESFTASYERNGHIWAKDIFQGFGGDSDWAVLYQQILYANIVLEGLQKITRNDANQPEYDRIKGHALFIRGHALFNLSQVFAEAYDANTANSVLGLPIRLESDVAVQSHRANLQQTYDQLLDDLKKAESLLPHKVPGADRNRPYKVAAQALLARVYLSMRNYDLALQYAESALNLYSTLMSFPTLSTTSIAPIVLLNPETMYFCNPFGGASRLIATNRVAPNTLVNTELYNMYAANDLRKTILFTNSTIHQKPVFKATYDGTTRAFSGIATDEVYLIKAECQVRVKNYQDGLNTLNALLLTRWKKDTFVNFTAINKDDALVIVLRERRKELPLRGLRWQDLRRLNKEGANITLTRVLEGDPGGKPYILPPNSPLYVLPIPPEEIRISGLEQNIR